MEWRFVYITFLDCDWFWIILWLVLLFVVNPFWICFSIDWSTVDWFLHLQLVCLIFLSLLCSYLVFFFFNMNPISFQYDLDFDYIFHSYLVDSVCFAAIEMLNLFLLILRNVLVFSISSYLGHLRVRHSYREFYFLFFSPQFWVEETIRGTLYYFRCQK